MPADTAHANAALNEAAPTRMLRQGLEAVVLLLMAALALVVVLGVGFRKFGSALVWYDEVASVLLAWLTYYGAALAALDRRHIGVPTLVDALPTQIRVLVVWAAEAVVLTFFALVAWAGVRVLQVLSGTALVSLPWVPTSVAQSVMPIGAVLFVLARLSSFPRVLERVRAGLPLSGEPTPDPAPVEGSTA